MNQQTILVIDGTESPADKDSSLQEIQLALNEQGFLTHISQTPESGLLTFLKDQSIVALIIDWKIAPILEKTKSTIEEVVHFIREHNDEVPIFIMTDKQKIMEVSAKLLENIQGYIWRMEDTPSFIAGRVIEAAKKYIDSLLPPFFKHLKEYANESKYGWHTPGHCGGLAFLKSPVGRQFYDFYGENVFRTDLSASVADLGSLLKHTGSCGEAEKHAATIFNADHTFFVTNGTSTANKIVLSSILKRGDIVFVDRNCHKSILHSLLLTGAKPVYLQPQRNAYGIIGGIQEHMFTKKHLLSLMKNSPIVPKNTTKAKALVLTNSTYDGLVYDIEKIREGIKEVVEVFLCDEAWFAYAHFHHLYKKRHATYFPGSDVHPLLFATQSSHKMLAAFSQASMIHVKEGKRPFDKDHFNQAFMMHTSTSPQYNIIASCDIAAHMMKGKRGFSLIEDTLEEALVFREKMKQIEKEMKSDPCESKQWWFSIWEPPSLSQTLSTRDWELQTKETWHGFTGIADRFLMLDPLKVTILTPGLHTDCGMDGLGIPAKILSYFLSTRGIVEEKTGFYNILALFSLGITKGKSSVLLSALFEFKEAYDHNLPLSDVFPDLVQKYPKRYEKMTLQTLCGNMHSHLKDANIPKVTIEVFETLPPIAVTPCEAYEKYIDQEVEDVPLNKLDTRIAATTLVPFPPGIPLIMPGELFCNKTADLITYLTLLETFSNSFPGFETEIHGITEKKINGKIQYHVRCLKE